MCAVCSSEAAEGSTGCCCSSSESSRWHAAPTLNPHIRVLLAALCKLARKLEAEKSDIHQMTKLIQIYINVQDCLDCSIYRMDNGNFAYFSHVVMIFAHMLSY